MGDRGQYSVDSLPFFMKTISRLAITNDYPSYMSFPKEFADQQGNKITRDVILKTSGSKWCVRIGPVKNGTMAFRGTGWVKFVKDNKLAIGDQVTFTMLSGTLFSVKIVRAEYSGSGSDVLQIKVKEEPIDEAGDSVPVYKPSEVQLQEQQHQPPPGMEAEEVDLSSPPQASKDLGAPPTPPPPPSPSPPSATKETIQDVPPMGNVQAESNGNKKTGGAENETSVDVTKKRVAQHPPEDSPPVQRMRKKVSASPTTPAAVVPMTPSASTLAPESGFNPRYATRSSTGARKEAKEAPGKDEYIASRTRSSATKQNLVHAEENEAVRQDISVSRDAEQRAQAIEAPERRLGTEQDPFVLDISGGDKTGGIHLLMKTENDKAYKLFISASAVEDIAKSCAKPERPAVDTPVQPPPPERPAETTPASNSAPTTNPTPASNYKAVAVSGQRPRITVPIRTTTVQSYSRLAIDKVFAEKWLPHESCSIKVVDARGTVWWMHWVDNEKRLKTEGWEKLVKHYNLQIGDVCLLEVMEPMLFRLSFNDAEGKPKSNL